MMKVCFLLVKLGFLIMLYLFSQDQYANYVVQKMIDVAESSQVYLMLLLFKEKHLFGVDINQTY